MKEITLEAKTIKTKQAFKWNNNKIATRQSNNYLLV